MEVPAIDMNVQLMKKSFWLSAQFCSFYTNRLQFLVHKPLPLFCRLIPGNIFATNWITFMSETTADVTIAAAADCGLFTQRKTTRSR